MWTPLVPVALPSFVDPVVLVFLFDRLGALWTERCLLIGDILDIHICHFKHVLRVFVDWIVEHDTVLYHRLVFLDDDLL